MKLFGGTSKKNADDKMTDEEKKKLQEATGLIAIPVDEVAAFRKRLADEEAAANRDGEEPEPESGMKILITSLSPISKYQWSQSRPCGKIYLILKVNYNHFH